MELIILFSQLGFEFIKNDNIKFENYVEEILNICIIKKITMELEDNTNF